MTTKALALAVGAPALAIVVVTWVTQPWGWTLAAAAAFSALLVLARRRVSHPAGRHRAGRGDELWATPPRTSLVAAAPVEPGGHVRRVSSPKERVPWSYDPGSAHYRGPRTVWLVREGYSPREALAALASPVAGGSPWPGSVTPDERFPGTGELPAVRGRMSDARTETMQFPSLLRD